MVEFDYIEMYMGRISS